MRGVFHWLDEVSIEEVDLDDSIYTLATPFHRRSCFYCAKFLEGFIYNEADASHLPPLILLPPIYLLLAL